MKRSKELPTDCCIKQAFILHYNDPADGDDDSEVSDDGLEDLLGWACMSTASPPACLLLRHHHVHRRNQGVLKRLSRQQNVMMELASDCRDAASGKDSESTWLSQCFLANRGKWGGRASKLLNRTWRVIYGRLGIGIRCTHPNSLYSQ